MPPGIHFFRRLRLTAHQHAVAEKAVHHLHHAAVVEDELVVSIEPAILQHTEKFGRARGQRERVFLFVSNDDQCREPLIHLRAGPHMRVRVIPIGPRAIADFELVHVLAAGADGQTRMAVGGLGHVQSVPVDDRAFAQLIHEPDADLLSASQANDRPEVRTRKLLQRAGRPFDQPPGEAPHARAGAGEHLSVAGRRRQDQFDIRNETLGESGLPGESPGYGGEAQ